MPSHKPLKSVSHNFGNSIISLMNYINDDYFLGHLLKQVRATNLSRLTVDIIQNKAQPEELLNQALSASIEHYSKWFPQLIENSGSTMDYVQSATMIIEFDLLMTRPFAHDTKFIENPFFVKSISSMIEERSINIHIQDGGFLKVDDSFL